MQGYQTEQKRLLFSYLQSHADEAFSMQALCAVMAGCGVGRSTVYRLIRQMCQDGQVRQLPPGEGRRSIAYQYLSGGSACRRHLHLRCLQCGRVLHADDTLTAAIEKQLLASQGFTLDEGQAILPGLCSHCHVDKE